MVNNDGVSEKNHSLSNRINGNEIPNPNETLETSSKIGRNPLIISVVPIYRRCIWFEARMERKRMISNGNLGAFLSFAKTKE